MPTLNRVFILGTLGNDLKLKQTKTGRPFCRLSLATEYWGAHGPDGTKKTTWHSVHVFGKQAEAAAKRLKKGESVFVEGRLESSSTELEGQTQWHHWITAEHVNFLGFRKYSESTREKMLETVSLPVEVARIEREFLTQEQLS